MHRNVNYKEKKPTPTNASKYGIKEKTVSAVLIIIAKEKWLATNSDDCISFN